MGSRRMRTPIRIDSISAIPRLHLLTGLFHLYLSKPVIPFHYMQCDRKIQ